MKFAHWIAVFLLVLMVGGITFVSVNLGGGNNDPADAPIETTPYLTFAAKSYPQPGERLLTTEVHQLGHQDYWFVNDNWQDVHAGLIKKNCQCMDVEIRVAPESWKARQLGEEAGNAVAWMARHEHDRRYPELPNDEATPQALTKENSVRVPAGAIGRVRLSWRQNEAKPFNTYADLWMGQRDGNVAARLESNVKIADPIEAGKEVSITSVDIRDLEEMKNGLEVTIPCWSRTRSSFRIKAKLSHDRVNAQADPIAIGEPIPLTREEINRLESREPNMPAVLCGYRIPVTVRAKAADGTAIEWGFFRRYVELTSSDEGIEPVQVRVQGEVRGDVAVDGGKGGGAIDLGPFPRSRGARGIVLLRTEEDNLKLRLDAARLPDYLKARLDAAEKEASRNNLNAYVTLLLQNQPLTAVGCSSYFLATPKTPAGPRLWKLHVEVPPRKANGEFPRADTPRYRDSAIYVTIVEEQANKPPRTIRIPVLGVAVD